MGSQTPDQRALRPSNSPLWACSIIEVRLTLFTAPLPAMSQSLNRLPTTITAGQISTLFGEMFTMDDTFFSDVLTAAVDGGISHWAMTRNAERFEDCYVRGSISGTLRVNNECRVPPSFDFLRRSTAASR